MKEMNLKQALELVLELASQNVLSEEDAEESKVLEECRNEQLQALAMVENADPISWAKEVHGRSAVIMWVPEDLEGLSESSGLTKEEMDEAMADMSSRLEERLTERGFEILSDLLWFWKHAKEGHRN